MGQQQPRIPQQQQPRIPQQQQPRIAPQPQQPRTPPQQQQPRVAPQPQQQQPRVAPQPQQQPRQPPPAQGAQPKTTQLTALQKAILKNAGVTKIPDQIEKVEKSILANLDLSITFLLKKILRQGQFQSHPSMMIDSLELLRLYPWVGMCLVDLLDPGTCPPSLPFLTVNYLSLVT